MKQTQLGKPTGIIIKGETHHIYLLLYTPFLDV